MTRELDRAFEMQEKISRSGLAVEIFFLNSGWHARIFVPKDDTTIGLGLEQLSKEFAIADAIDDAERRFPGRFMHLRR